MCDTGGTFKSDTPGTFVSDIGGTFEVILSLYKGIREYMEYYNYNRAHQGIGRQIPAAVYKTVA